MESIKRAAKITFRRLEDFFAEAKKRNLKQVFRSWGDRDDSHNAHYTGWDEGSVFLIGTILFPELKKLAQSLPEHRYHSSGWSVNENGRMAIDIDNKTHLIKALQALGVGEELKELKKLTIESIRGIVDESTDEEDRETRYHRGGIYIRKMACNTVDGLIKELEVKITVDDRRDASYKILLSDWREVARQLEQRHEKCFHEADIRVVSGEVELV